MHWFILAALAIAVAALLWCVQTIGKYGGNAGPQPAAEDEEAFQEWMNAPANLETVGNAVELLVELMSHPELGGPGFLSIRLPQTGEAGSVMVTAQYPNIREVLYRRVARRELGRADLLQAGVPEALLNLSPDFETDSGGVVVVSIRSAAMSPEVTAAISGRADRQAALNLLTARLGERFPALEVRPFGTELLLTPVREAER